MGGRLWNLGLRVADLEADLAFLRACGAEEIAMSHVSTPDGTQLYATAMFFGQRLNLFSKAVYEDALPRGLHTGLTHIVFEVPDVEGVVQQNRTYGVEPFWGPVEVSGEAFGRRRIAFFRSPSGFIFEVFETLVAPQAASRPSRGPGGVG